jgi:hypothetical protein
MEAKRADSFARSMDGKAMTRRAERITYRQLGGALSLAKSTHSAPLPAACCDLVSRASQLPCHWGTVLADNRRVGGRRSD